MAGRLVVCGGGEAGGGIAVDAGAAVDCCVAAGGSAIRWTVRAIGATGLGGEAAPSLISAPRPYAEPPRAVNRATRRAVRAADDIGGSEASGPGVTSGWDSAFSGSPNSHSKLAGPSPRLSGVIAGAGGAPAASRGAWFSATGAGATARASRTRCDSSGATARCGDGGAGDCVTEDGGEGDDVGPVGRRSG
ncbi:MAG TPA: hypothetical protein VMJ65_08475 [Solirubrobacteraceae bacterium]|nr:hypothetical protein [Solirubrobacteraceae bacterium]